MGDELGARIRNESQIERRLDGTHRHIVVVVGPHAGVGLRLDRFLAAALDTLSRSLIRRWLERGWCSVDGREARPSHKVRAGERIELHCELPPPPPDRATPCPPLDILFDEAGVLVVDKPAGVLAHQAGRVLSGTLLNRIQELCIARGLDPREARLVNRIDRDTSGIVLATLDAQSHRLLSIALQRGELHKEYRAICHGVPSPAAGRWLDPIRDDPTGDSIARQIHPDGQPSDTEYRVLERADERHALLALVLHTGRQHQIRVHAAGHGHPLVGDWVYGPACLELAGQALHAAVLDFPHPCEDRRVRVEAPLPAALARLWEDLRAGGSVTARPLDAEERRRLAAREDLGDDGLPEGWRRPSWLSSDELRALREEVDDG